MHKEIIPKEIWCPDLVIQSDGYTLLKAEWERYHNFKPSIFQRIFWVIYPTLTSVKWQRYKDISIEEFSR